MYPRRIKRKATTSKQYKNSSAPKGKLDDICHLIKKQANADYYEKKYQSLKTDHKMIQIIELVNKGIKAVIIIVFYVFKKPEEN